MLRSRISQLLLATCIGAICIACDRPNPVSVDNVEVNSTLENASAQLASELESQASVLRILTWEGYTPVNLVREFERATGTQVEVTYLKSNAEIVEKLVSAANAEEYDLVYPLVNDVFVTQVQFALYQPIDLNRINNLDGLIAPLADQVATFTTTERGQYALPAMWGTSGLIVNTAKVDRSIQSYQDLCDPTYENLVTYPLQFSTFIAAAYAIGYDPLQYIQDNPGDIEGWSYIIEEAYYYLLDCHYNVSKYWKTYQDHADLMYEETAILSMGWSSTGWLLNRVNPQFQFITPREGSLGWLSTFAIPKEAENLEAVYQWINFTYRPQNAAILVEESGFLSPVQEFMNYLPKEQRDLIQQTVDPDNLQTVNWYPPRLPEVDLVVEEYIDKLKTMVD